jgi:hypothetical protein
MAKTYNYQQAKIQAKQLMSIPQWYFVDREGRTDMMKAVKESVHRMTNQLQLISGYLEMEVYPKALGKTRETMKELHTLATSLTGLAQVGMTVPQDGAVTKMWTWMSAVMKCGQLTRMKYALATARIILRRNEDLIATNEHSLPLLLRLESVSSLSELLIPNPPQFRLGLWVALLAE